MRKLIQNTTIVLSVLLYSGTLYSQLVADAGQIKHFCKLTSLPPDTVRLGGNQVATGGMPPYTYTWTISPNPIVDSIVIGNTVYIMKTYASNLLDDTTLAHPQVVSVPDQYVNVLNPAFHFILKVEDSLGNVAYDSVQVTFSLFGTNLSGCMYYQIALGDSIHLSGGRLFGGIPPLSILWQPNLGLTDSTSWSFWAKPPHSVDYFQTLMDDVGCVIKDAYPMFCIYVNQVGTEKYFSDKNIKIIPNPINLKSQITIEVSQTGQGKIALYSITGKLLQTVYQGKFRQGKQTFTLHRSGFGAAGIYILRITINGQTVNKKVVVR